MAYVAAMPLYIYTPAQVQRIGLKMVGIDQRRQQRQSQKSNLEDFKTHYCVDPIVCAMMWEDLQTTAITEARIKASAPDNRNNGANLKNFLRAFHFLMRYGTEGERKASSGNCKNTVRKWTWFFCQKIEALKQSKVRQDCGAVVPERVRCPMRQVSRRFRLHNYY